MDRSIHCDRNDHRKCDGSALIFDTEDGFIDGLLDRVARI